MPSHSIRQRAGRNVLVHLPPGYDVSRPEPYPLLLLHDGQNLAHWRDEAQGGSWHADETIDRLVADSRIPPVVMVGIDHAGDERIGEFTPAASDDGGGPPSVYGRWIVDHLIPDLADDLNVRPDVRGVTLGGSSLGGLVTLWIASISPGQFGRLMVMSPSVWWDNHMILRHLREQPIDTATRIWLDVGRDEGKSVVRDARALRDLLREQHHDQLCYLEDPDGDHTEASWGRRFSEALVWLYKS
jgi:enterochelin esterase-like enzyme